MHVIFTGIIALMYVELVISVLMIGLGICLIIGINHVCRISSLTYEVTKVILQQMFLLYATHY